MELVVVIALFVVLSLLSVACIVLKWIRSGYSRWRIIISPARTTAPTESDGGFRKAMATA